MTHHVDSNGDSEIDFAKLAEWFCGKWSRLKPYSIILPIIDPHRFYRSR